MKKVLNYILLTAVLGTFLPYSALAQTTDVGVNITGSVSIDVVTTISANITLDLTTGETTPTYMEIQNNSSVPVSAKITNISTTSEEAPSTFVGQYDKDWLNLSKTDTNTYVNFNILGEGQDVMPKNILPNTEIDLGVLRSFGEYGGDFVCAEYPCYVDVSNPNSQLFRINANFGMNWDEGDKNFTYQIETIYSQADSYIEKSYSMPSFFENINDLDISFSNCENTFACPNNETGINLHLIAAQTSQEFVNKLNNDLNDQLSIRIYVNGQIATKYDVFEITDYGYENDYFINALEFDQTNYLTIILEADKNEFEHYEGTSFTFIKKVAVYSE